jgi:hypothetical protein
LVSKRHIRSGEPESRENPRGARSEYMTDHHEPQGISSLPPLSTDRIADALSRERLSKYLARTGGQVELALDLYAWNQEVGAALTVTLAQVEVCLRNQVARVLADAYGPAWHRVARLRNAHAEVQHELDKAESRVKKAAPSVPDIVAASDFNLWRELCKPAYAGVFWAKRIPIAFPYTTFGGKERELLTALHRRVDLLLKLRNRIAHHEPIIGSNWEKVGAKLADRHHDATELLEWMSPDLARWVLARDRFPAVLAACPA